MVDSLTLLISQYIIHFSRNFRGGRSFSKKFPMLELARPTRAFGVAFTRQMVVTAHFVFSERWIRYRGRFLSIWDVRCDLLVYSVVETAG